MPSVWRVVMRYEMVSLYDCGDIAVGGEDEMIDLIDSRRSDEDQDDFSSDFEEI